MSSATISRLCCRHGAPFALASWLLATAHAQDAAGTAGNNAPPAAPTEAAVPAATAETAPTPAGIGVAAPIDNVAANQQFVASSITDFGRNSMQTAEAYVGLANAQRQTRLFEEAAESYLTAVEVYRAIDGPFTPLAIAPLTSLGDNYREANDNTSAVSAYSEARTVNRRVYGLHNADQIVLLDRMSESLLDLNQVTEAEAQQLEALRLIQRANAPDSDATLAGIYRYAEWLGERGMRQLQRDQYARALRLIRGRYGDRDLRQIDPLLGIGNTYRQERNPAGQGIAALEDALELLREQPEDDALAMARVLRDIGDWNTAFGKAGYAGMEYQRSWDLLGNLANAGELRKSWFGSTTYVLYEPISPRGVSTDPDAAAGYVLVRFDIDATGNPGNVAILESDPAGFKDEAALRHIRRSRFRPWVVDGVTAPGFGLAMRIGFRYLPEAVTSGNSN